MDILESAGDEPEEERKLPPRDYVVVPRGPDEEEQALPPLPGLARCRSEVLKHFVLVQISRCYTNLLPFLQKNEVEGPNIDMLEKLIAKTYKRVSSLLDALDPLFVLQEITALSASLSLKRKA